MADRKEALMPKGNPKYIRVYDNGGETADRYTVVFTGRYTHKTNGSHFYLGMSTNPFHPQGIGMHGESSTLIDKPTYKHLGKKIDFELLTTDCKNFVTREYKDLWDIE
jgi:hypothetical protein